MKSSLARARVGLAPAVLLVSLALLVACDEPPTPEPARWDASAFPPRLVFELPVEGRTVRLELERNAQVVAPTYRGAALDPERSTTPSADAGRCLYRGRVTQSDGATAPTDAGWVALSLCDGPDGLMVLDGVAFDLAPGARVDEVLIARTTRDARAPSERATLVLVDHDGLATMSAPLSVPTKFLEIVLVSDARAFQLHGVNTNTRALALANAADALFRNGGLQPPIGVVVKQHIVQTTTDPWSVQVVGSEANANSLFASFSTWAHAQTTLAPTDMTVLLSGWDFAGSSLGLTTVGGACSDGVGIVQARGPTTGLDAFVLTHELGHALGMRHDSDGNACSSSAHIMGLAVSLDNLPTTWSTCSQAALSSWFASGVFGSPALCLDNVPDGSVSARCGDGIVQINEQCDCGDNDCAGDDACCDGATCMFVAGAECSARDGCCAACQIVGDSRRCYVAASECETDTFCNNVAPECPPLKYKASGTTCHDGLTATGGQCLEGQCTSFAAQCDALEPVFNLFGLVPCAFQAQFNGGNACGVLYCGNAGNASSCLSFTSPTEPDGNVHVDDGASCGTASQCVDGQCEPSAQQPVCSDGGATNACGGCGELAGAPGTSCGACKAWTCATKDSAVCTSTACYAWVAGTFSPCSATCGGGTRTRSVQCVDQSTGTPVSDVLCSGAGTKPATTESCNTQACTTYAWAMSEFSACSTTCGGGVRTRLVECVVEQTHATVPDSLCAGEGPKPATTESCNTQACTTYAWAMSEFSACSTTCGGGVRTRLVECVVEQTNATVPDSLCAGEGPKPATTESCNTQACTTYAWAMSEFSACSTTCGGGVRTRLVECIVEQTNATVPDSLCAGEGPKPATTESCNTQACTTYAWAMSEFSACSTTCGGGVRTRLVECVVEQTNATVPDSLCAGEGPKPATTESCNTQACTTYAWAMSEFSACSTICGGGVRTRLVECIVEQTNATVPDSLCAGEGPKPATTESCNTQACTTYAWAMSEFSACSTTCGGGVRTRLVECVVEQTNATVPDSLCAGEGPKPATTESCNTQACTTYAWAMSEFSACSTTCGGGVRTRLVECIVEQTNATVPDSLCAGEGPKPATTESCNTQACTTYAWAMSEFSACSTTCGGGVRTRLVECVVEQTNATVPDSLCAGEGPKPATTESCNTQACTTYAWAMSEFSACSTICGGGVRTRLVECIVEQTNATVPDSLCAGEGPKPATTESCNTQACTTYAWAMSEFSACSTTCGGGVQARTVQCVLQQTNTPVPDSFCTDPKPPAEASCNNDPCPTWSWVAGEFSACSLACGGGIQSRSVVCVFDLAGTIVDDGFCLAAGPKPVTVQPCDELCAAGFECVTGTCAPIDACAPDSPCPPGESCAPIGPGTFICCAPGTAVDGTSGCVDIDECADGNNGGCDPTVSCDNVEGGRICGALDACHPALFCPADVPECPSAPDPGCHCANGVEDADETGRDCGGATCGQCPGELCSDADQCASGVCEAKRPDGPMKCKAPRCDDGVHNGSEMGLDCGGSCAARCVAGTACEEAHDCLSKVCADGYCAQATCDDGIKNADESAKDCGGHCGATCQTNKACDSASDCRSGLCDDGRCDVADSCTNGVHDSAETATDCGGPDCAPCGRVRACQIDLDCRSDVCEAGVCAAR